MDGRREQPIRRFLNGFSDIFSAIFQKPFTVENPFRWMTKAEVVKSIRDRDCGELIKHTVSCTHVWEMTTLKTHCGTCSQCIDRRYGTLAAGCPDSEDPEEMYGVDLLRGERPPGDSRTMLESYVAMAKRVRSMSDTAFFTEFGEVHRVTPQIRGMSVHDAATRILGLYKRHATELGDVITKGIQNHAQDISDGKLPSSSLLILALPDEYKRPATFAETPSTPVLVLDEIKDGETNRGLLDREEPHEVTRPVGSARERTQQPTGPTCDDGPEAATDTNPDVEATRPDGAGDTFALRDRQPSSRVIAQSTLSLRPHPQYHELWGPIASTRVARVSQQVGPIVDPLVTTTDGTILDGRARWQVAMQRQQTTVPCLVCDVSQEEALEIVIQRHRAAGGLNPYARILLALSLEAHLRKQTASSAATNVGGGTPSSNLTKRESRDVRRDIARIACVSTGNVTKVKQVLDAVIPEIRERLLRGDVSIHRAWQWRTLGKKEQSDALWAHLNRRDLKTTIRQLVKRYAKSPTSGQPIDIAPTVHSGPRHLRSR